MTGKNKNAVALWLRSSDNVKAPALSGTVVVSRETLKEMLAKLGDGSSVTMNIAVWQGKSEHPKAPQYTGSATFGGTAVQKVEAAAEAAAAPKVNVVKVKRQPKADPRAEVLAKMEAMAKEFAALKAQLQ
jgi:hypothetical protein